MQIYYVAGLICEEISQETSVCILRVGHLAVRFGALESFEYAILYDHRAVKCLQH